MGGPQSRALQPCPSSEKSPAAVTHESVLSESGLPPALHMGALIFSQAPSCPHPAPAPFRRMSTECTSFGSLSWARRRERQGESGRLREARTLPLSPKRGFFVGPEVWWVQVLCHSARPLQPACEWCQSPRVWKVPGCPSSHTAARCWVSEQLCRPFLCCGTAVGPQQGGLPFRTWGYATYSLEALTAVWLLSSAASKTEVLAATRKQVVSIRPVSATSVPWAAIYPPAPVKAVFYIC